LEFQQYLCENQTNIIMETSTENSLECCPPFNPEPWDGKIQSWENKTFIKDKVTTLFYMPLNFGKVMRRIDEKIRAAGATVPDNLGLSDHTSKWNMNIYVAVDKEIPGADNTLLNGQFYSKVYEGPFKDTGKWMKDAEAATKAKGMNVKKWYMRYTTCPKCAKKYGKNYVVMLGEVA